MSDDVDNGEVKLSDISDIGQSVPKGRYMGKLSAVNGKMSNKGVAPTNPMVEAIFDILAGDQEGMTLNIYHSLKISQSTIKSGPNKGKPQYFAPGISDMRAACAAVGQPLPDVNFKKNPTIEDALNWAKEYGARLHPKHGPVEIVVIEEPRKKKDDKQGSPTFGKWIEEKDDEGKTRMTTRAKVVGKWKGEGGGTTTAGASTAGIGLA